MQRKNEERIVRFTDDVLVDLKWMNINREEWQAIKRELARIAKVRNILADHAVCRVAQTDGEWLRLKIRHPSQLRVFFTTEEDDSKIVVRAIFRRTERTYDMVELVFRKHQRALA